MKTITVIVPVYEVEATINRCVESIVKQTYRNLEIILVDDGSPDSSPALCDAWATKDDRIRVIHKINGGLSEARNTGLDCATGDYIAFVDSDDYLEPNMYEKLLASTEEKQSAFAVCSYYNVSADSASRSVIDFAFDKDTVSFRALLSYICEYTSSMIGVVAWNKLFRRSLWEQVRFPANTRYEDELALTEILMKDENGIVSLVNEPLYHYVYNSQSITHKGFSIDNLHIVDIYKEQIDFFKQQRVKDCYAKKLFGICCEIRKYYFAVCNHHLDADIGRRLVKDYRKYYLLYLESLHYNRDKKLNFYNFLFFPNPKLYVRIINRLNKNRSS